MDIDKLCYDVIGAAMRVHSFFGDGYLEEVYKNALVVELTHEAQLVNYPAATGIDDGMLFNFGTESLQYKHKYRKYRKSCKSC